MRTSLMTCWLTILFILLLTDVSLSRRKGHIYKGQKFGSSNHGSVSRKAASRIESPSHISLSYMNLPGPAPPPPLPSGDSFKYMPLTKLKTVAYLRMHDFNQRKSDSSKKPKSSSKSDFLSDVLDSGETLRDVPQIVQAPSEDKSSSPRENNHHNPIGHQHIPASLKIPALFQNKPNISQSISGVDRGEWGAADRPRHRIFWRGGLHPLPGIPEPPKSFSELW